MEIRVSLRVIVQILRVELRKKLQWSIVHGSRRVAFSFENNARGGMIIMHVTAKDFLP